MSGLSALQQINYVSGLPQVASGKMFKLTTNANCCPSSHFALQDTGTTLLEFHWFKVLFLLSILFYSNYAIHVFIGSINDTKYALNLLKNHWHLKKLDFIYLFF